MTLDHPDQLRIFFLFSVPVFVLAALFRGLAVTLGLLETTPPTPTEPTRDRLRLPSHQEARPGPGQAQTQNVEQI